MTEPDNTPALEYAASVHRSLARVNGIRSNVKILLMSPPDALTGEQWQTTVKALDDLIELLVQTIVEDTEYTLETHEQIMSLNIPPAKQ